MRDIEFYSEDTEFKPDNPEIIRRWLEGIVTEASFKLQELNFIFCTDEYLHKMNQQYLSHDTYTDIITFDNSDESGIIEGDVFISIERVEENAKNMGIDFKDELHRVMAHGVLHLLGYTDKSLKEKEEMRKKEDSCLSLLNN